MGYDLHITRAKHWTARAEYPITEEEWLAVVAQDPTLSVNEKDYMDYNTDGGQIRRVHPVVWTEAEEQDNCFWWYDGEVTCKNPYDEWIAKAVRLAKELNAKVMGDEGEEYGDEYAVEEEYWKEGGEEEG
jgi:hypothetical protein